MVTETETTSASDGPVTNAVTGAMARAALIHENEHLRGTAIGRAASKVIGINLTIQSMKDLFNLFGQPFLGKDADEVIMLAGKKANEFASDPQNKEKLDSFKKDVLGFGKNSLSGAMATLGSVIESNENLFEKLGGGELAKMVVGFIKDFELDKAEVLQEEMKSRTPKARGGAPSTPRIKEPVSELTRK